MDNDTLRIDQSNIWGIQDILENDQELNEFEMNFPHDEVGNTLLSDSTELFMKGISQPQTLIAVDDCDEVHYHDDDNSSESSDTNQDGMYYFI